MYPLSDPSPTVALQFANKTLKLSSRSKARDLLLRQATKQIPRAPSALAMAAFDFFPQVLYAGLILPPSAANGK
jgi:hypothetical protein